jgi:hypothetical protein
MVEPTRYPDSEDGGESQAAAGRSVRSKLIVAAVAAFVVLFVVLHLTGVLGPGH